MSSVRPGRGALFGLITVVCATIAIVYVLLADRSSRSRAGIDGPGVDASEPRSPIPPPTEANDAIRPPAVISSPPTSSPPTSSPRHENHSRLAMLNMQEPETFSTVVFVSENAVDSRTPTGVRCERVHFARTRGICLTREIRLFAAQTVATILDGASRTLFTIRAEGIPSRARVSADGRYAAFTTFVTGHSYADAQVSTATVLLDAATGSTVANLEQFTVLRDGQILQSPDFNYWGVTFQRDSNAFFATLRTGGTNYLVRGDIAARTVTILYAGVECPSLSPDETRVAFKKLRSRGDWRLTVLDLTRLAETPLAEIRSVDDQAEWLDDTHVLYTMVEDAPAVGTNVLVVAADGSGQPQVFAQGAASPAVLR